MACPRVSKLALALMLLAIALTACGGQSGPGIQVEDVWSRPAKAMAEMESDQSTEGDMGQGQGMAGTGAVFMLLVNKGGEADRLVGAKTDVAKVVEIHETVMDGEVMKMQMLPDGLEVAAKSEVLLKPGSYHVMLIGMKQDLNAGDIFSIDLEFEKSGVITVEPDVREP